jgi:excisionase family DNA binding protein
VREALSEEPTSREVPFRERISCSITEACQATGLGRTKLYMLIDAGAVTSTMVGRRRLILMDSLLALLDPKRKSTNAAPSKRE